MPPKNSFAGLDGFFDATQEPQFHRLSPEEHQALIESEHVRGLLGTSPYVPEDVVGVAFGTTHQNEGVQLRQIYFTQRGLREQGNSESNAILNGYTSLRRQAIVKSDGELLPLFERKGFQSLANRFGKNIEYRNLGGPDGKKRVLIIYSCYISDYTT